MAFKEGMKLAEGRPAFPCDAFKTNVDITVCEGGCRHFIEKKTEEIKQAERGGEPEVTKEITLVLCGYPRWLCGQTVGMIRKGD